MKSILVVLALSCCSLLLICPCSTAFAATPIAVSQVSSASGNASGAFDPYVGQGDLISKAVPMCCCSTWNFVCEDVPAGAVCNPNNHNCKCNGNGACINNP